MDPSTEQMPAEQAVAQGIAALRAGDRARAQMLLTHALQRDPHNEEAWLWLSGAVESEAERRYCLERVLAINPNSDAAQRGLESLPHPPEAPAVGPLFPPPAPIHELYQPPRGTIPIHPKQITETRYVDAVCTIDEWLNCLRDVALYDAEGDSLRRTMAWSAALLFAIGLLAVLITGSFGALLLFVALAVLALALFVIFKRKDLPNSLRLFVVPLLAVLREDMEPGALLALRLDLRGGTIADKTVRGPSPHPDAGSYPRTVESYYHDPWMAGRASLADGSTLEWRIVDHIRERRITRRNTRGKAKTKQKYKIKTLMEVSIKLRPEAYALVGDTSPPASGEQVKLKPGEHRNLIRVRRTHESRTLNAVPDLDSLLDLIAGAYRRSLPQPSKEDQR